MGVYYTCDICGKTEKGMFPCDCHLQMAKAKIQNLVGKVVLQVQIVQNGETNAMIFKVQDPNEWNSRIFYVYVETGGREDQDDYNRATVDLIEQDEFEELLAGKEQEDDSDSDVCVQEGNEDTEDEDELSLKQLINPLLAFKETLDEPSASITASSVSVPVAEREARNNIQCAFKARPSVSARLRLSEPCATLIKAEEILVKGRLVLSIPSAPPMLRYPRSQ